MATLYVTEQGAVIRKTGRRLVVDKEGKPVLDLPAFKVERVVIFGSVQISTQAMVFMLDEGIDVSFMSVKGKYRGRLASAESRNVHVRIEQYRRYMDESFRLEVGRTVVGAKIANARAVLLRYARNHPETNIDVELERMSEAIQMLGRKKTVGSIRGIEGVAASCYFSALRKMFVKGPGFQKRTKRPPADPVNAAMSLAYAVVGNEIVSCLCAEGLDPYVGYYHGIEYSRPSLSLDILEEFRHPVADGLVLRLFNLGVLSDRDFIECEDGGGPRLRPDALRVFLSQYEQRVTQEFTDRSGERTCYRMLFRRQVDRMRKAIVEGGGYTSFRV